jgi:hypothetical protein
MSPKSIGWIALAGVLTFAVGWLAGSSGRWGAEQDRRVFEARAEFAAARARILEGRVSLFEVNFGDASRRFEEARVIVERVQTRLRETGEAERAGRLELVLTELREAPRLASSLDAAAQNAAVEAVRALDAAAPPADPAPAPTSGSSRSLPPSPVDPSADRPTA